MKKVKVFRPRGYLLTESNERMIKDNSSLGVDFKIIDGDVHAICDEGLVKISINPINN